MKRRVAIVLAAALVLWYARDGGNGAKATPDLRQSTP